LRPRRRLTGSNLSSAGPRYPDPPAGRNRFRGRANNCRNRGGTAAHWEELGAKAPPRSRSRRTWCRISIDGLYSIRKHQPTVHILGPHGLIWQRESGVGKSANGHADQVRQPCGLPIQIGAAARAKIKGYRETARRIAGKLARGSLFAMNAFAGIKCRDAKEAASAALAIKAMAHRNLRRLALASQSYGPTMALGGS
jgi:hypothetical protein